MESPPVSSLNEYNTPALPVKGIVVGLSVASLTTDSEADFGPKLVDTCGANAIDAVQDWFANKTEQLWLKLKLPLSDPVIASEDTGRVEPPELRIVTFCEGLNDPANTEPKSMADGFSVNFRSCPDRATVTGDEEPFEEIEI